MLFERVDRWSDLFKVDKDEEIELNKKMSATMATVREKIKPRECLYCGKKVSSLCNSHTIPRYCLENIGINGEVTGPNSIYKLPKMGVSIGKECLGLNESGTFSLICRECDSKIFQEYENPQNYLIGKKPTKTMMAQIAVKNYLKLISKRRIENALNDFNLNKLQSGECQNKILLIEALERKKIDAIDLSSYTMEYEKAKKYLEEGKGNGYYLFYYRLLNYVVPITIQTALAISIDFNGEIVNDLFNKNSSYELKDLHLCVFPQKTTTAVFMFLDEGDVRYRKFRKQFNKLGEEEKLAAINYLVFLYSEDYFLAKNIKERVDLDSFNEIANTTPIMWSSTPFFKTTMLSEKFDLSKWSSIPNLLSEEYKI